MTEQHKRFPEFYVTAPQPCPYLPGRRERKLFTHLTHDKPRGAVDALLRRGFRRSQNIAYMPYCEGCQACISVRVLVDEFRHKRSFQRVVDYNRDLVATRLGPRPTAEQYALFRDYIEARHAGGGMADMSILDYAMMVEDSILDTFVTEYRLRSPSEPQVPGGRGPLLGLALCDRLSDGISMVYSFYDPEAHRRSLGTYMILDQIAHARRLGLPYVYLGYWIAGSRKMRYKARFQPQEALSPDGWLRV
jgi:arginyl-tRNA--protein-N-Asp/Glu arginylyltransferase